MSCVVWCGTDTKLIGYAITYLFRMLLKAAVTQQKLHSPRKSNLFCIYKVNTYSFDA